MTIIHKIITIKQKEKRLLNDLNFIISNGLYYYEAQSFKKHSFRTLFKIKRLLIHTHFVFGIHKKGNNKSITLCYGNIKRFVALSDDYAYCFYPDRDSYIRLINNYNDYGDVINYPIIRPSLYDDNHLMIRFNRVGGGYA